MLLAIVTAVYLHECAVWHRPGRYWFFGVPKKCRARPTPMWPINSRGGFSFVNPLHIGSCFAADGASLDSESATARVKEWHFTTLLLRIVGTVLLVVVLGGAFLMSWFGAWSGFWATWVGLGMALWLGCAASAVVVRMRLGGCGLASALRQSAVLLTSPLTATRAVDRISAELLTQYHPLAAAHVLCDEIEFRRLVRTFVFPHKQQELTIDRSELEQFLRRLRRLQILSETPMPEDDAPRYCPRCWVRYRRAATECADCRIPLMLD